MCYSYLSIVYSLRYVHSLRIVVTAYKEIFVITSIDIFFHRIIDYLMSILNYSCFYDTVTYSVEKNLEQSYSLIFIFYF